MTVSEIVEKYGYTRGWWSRLAKQRVFPGAKQVGKMWLIPIEDVERYLASERKPGPKAPWKEKNQKKAN